MQRLSRQFGFTIIEVLVVIAILGVLTALTIVGVQGALLQSRNSQTTTVVQSYKKAILKYLNDNGAYPITASACLGEGYKDINNNGLGDCWHLNSPTQENPTFHSAIKPYMNNELPAPSQQILTAPSYDQVGASFYYRAGATLDGTAHSWFLAYTMEGNGTKCPVGPVLTLSGWPNFTSTQPASGYTEAFGTVATGCWIALPDPEKL